MGKREMVHLRFPFVALILMVLQVRARAKNITHLLGGGLAEKNPVTTGSETRFISRL